MTVQKLHENWRMRQCETGDWIEAAVPGSVYRDLLEHGLMEDPFYRDNETEALKLMERDYEYVTEFDVVDEVWDKSYILLSFRGLDTIADIWLNGVHLGYVDNMHRVWEYEMKRYLRRSGNTLKIRFYSPTAYIQKKEEEEHWIAPSEAMRGTSHIRKAQCMFGWDWGPRLPDAGIFREVLLCGCAAERFDSVYIRQKHEENRVSLYFDVDVSCFDYEHLLRFGKDGRELKNRGLSCRIIVEGPDGKLCCEKTLTCESRGESFVTIESPQLWWPNGLGGQPLYKVTAQLLKNDSVLDVFCKRIGLRTLTVRRERDAYGESFAHEVNGVQYFAMGADYIPEDNLLCRVTKERTRELLSQAVAANHNSIRVWGGGYYPDDFFWDACDELGLVVWMDFAFACSVYLLTEESFEENITLEVIQNIKRIRSHACLGLWCGNNEMESFYYMDSMGFGSDIKAKAHYIKLYEYLLPKLVKAYDPQTFYWPSSPSSGGGYEKTTNPDKGDVHYWDVWHGNKPFTEYRKFYFRYLSEFGFQSFPSIRTVESFTEPEDRNIFSYVMEKHQRNVSANGKIINYMEATYLYPNDLDTLIYASQLLQADAVRYGVEHFRRNRGRCMGTIIWQLNDCWPVASWASIDYYGRWKALHYYEKRFFAPLMISCEEEGLLSQNPNPNAEPYTLKKSICLCVANESREKQKVMVFWELRDQNAEVLESGKQELSVPAQSSVWMDHISMQHADERSQYVSYRMEQKGVEISGGTVLFTAPKFFCFADPQLTVQTEGDEIVVRAEAFAKSVEIRNKNDDMILSDNFFDMNGGERRVKIIKGIPESLEVRSVYNIR